MPNMYLATFDYIILGVVIILNLLFWKKNIKGFIGCFIPFLLFGIILPAISMKVEIDHYMKDKQGDIVDNFELLYTYFRFPIYWLIGILQVLVFKFKKQQ